MTALHPVTACPAGANRHVKLAHDHLWDRQLFLNLCGHIGRPQRAPAIRTGRRQRGLVPFIDPRRLPPAGRDTIAGTCSAAGPARPASERLRERCGLTTARPARSVQLPLQARVLVLESLVGLVQPPVLTFQLVPFTLDPLKAAPQLLCLLAPRALRLVLSAGSALHTPVMSHSLKCNSNNWISGRNPLTNYE